MGSEGVNKHLRKTRWQYIGGAVACVCVCVYTWISFPFRIIFLGFCSLSPFSLLLTELLVACWLMVMWRVKLCVRSSGVIFRICGVLRWHHPHPLPPKGTPSLIPWFPLEGPVPCMDVPYGTASLCSAAHVTVSSLGLCATFGTPNRLWWADGKQAAVNTVVNASKHTEDA